MKKIIFAILLLGLRAVAGPLGPLVLVDTIADVTNRPAITREVIAVLGYTTNNYFAEPIIYRHRPDLSASLHNPPLYIRESKGTNGVWRADILDSKEVPAEYFGVFPDGTDVTANLQRAANFCRISENTNSTPGQLDLSYGRTLVLGNKTTGAYTLNGTLYLNCNFDFSQAQIKASPLGTNVAIWVGPTGTNQLAIWNLRGKFPAVLYSTNAAYAEGTAITVAAVESCIFEYGFIEKYRIGTKFLGNNAGNARNVHINNFANACRYAWWLESFGPNGFCNLNQYLNFNALATVVPPGGTNVLTGYEQLVMTTDGSLNGNVFIGGGIEGFASARFMVITNGTGNTFRDFRLEQYPTIFTGQKPYWEVISTIGTSHGQDNHLYPATTIGMFAPPVRQAGNAAGNSSGGSRQFHFTQVDADKPAVYLEPTRYASVPLFTVYGMPTGTTGETNALSNPELYKLAMTPDVLGGKPASASSLRWYIENDVGTIRWRNTVSQQKMSINETQLAARVAGAADDHFTLGSQTARLSWLTNGTETVGVVTYGDGTLQIAGTHPTIGSNNLAGLTITGDDRGTAVRSLMTYSHLVGDYVQTAFGSFPSNYTENATVRDWAGGYVVNSANSQNRGMRFSANATNQFIDLIVGPYGPTQIPQLRVTHEGVALSNLTINNYVNAPGMGWIDPRAYGADPTDSNDDTAAVQAALAVAGSTMGVYFVPGTWLLDRLQVTNKNARLKGSSAGNTAQVGQTIFKPASTNYAVIFGNDRTRMEGAKIEGITFDGNGTQPYGLWINGGAYEVNVSDIAVRAFTGIGMLVGGNTNTPISIVNFFNSRFDAYEGLSTAAVKIQQTTNWPTAFVTAIGFHGCHFDEAGADDGSQTLWIDSVDVFADWGTYFDLGEGGEGILFSKSVSAVAPKLKGDFVAETNGGGVLARADFTQSNYRIGNLFPAGNYHLQGPVQWSDGTNITHFGRGWSYYQTFQDYPYILGGLNLQDPDDINGWDWNQKNQIAVTGGSLRLNSTTNQLYLLASSNSVITRTLSTNSSHFSLRVDATPTPTNHAASFGGSSYFTGQGKLGVNQTYPQADLTVGGGLSVGMNLDPGTGYIQGSKGFIVYPRTLVDNELAPFRSISHTLTSASGAVTNDFLHQFGFVTGNALDFAGASAYVGYNISRHTGSGLWNFVGGPYIESTVESTGSLLSAQGLTIRPITISSSGNAGSVFGLRVVSPTYSSTGVATNVYGIYVDNQTAAGNAYAIYTGNGLVRFGGNITAIGDVTVNGGITLGGVYRTTWPSGGGGATNGTDVWVEGVQQTTFNLQDGSEIAGAFSASNYTYSIVANSIATNKVDSTFRSFFKDRSTDTGTQTASTISDFADVQWANFTNSMVASNNISFAYDTSNKKLMISSTGGGAATNAPTIAVDGAASTNVNFADSSELLVTKTGTNVTYALATSGVTAGTYSNATITVDSKGRITVASTGSGGGSSTNTVSSIWKTIAGVSFVSTNIGSTDTVIDASTVVYGGAGTNLTQVGSSLINQAVYFKLSFATPLTHTNYLVFADMESDRGVGSAGIYVSAGVDTADGRSTNDVTFAVVSTSGSVNFNMGGRRIRVWVVDPSVVISGSELTEIPAHLLTGTIDDLRIPSTILRTNDAAATYATIDNPTFTGTATFADAVIPTLTVTNLIVPYQAYGSGWLTSTNVATQRAVAEKIVSMEDQYGTLPFVSLISAGSRMLIDDLFNPLNIAYGDAGTAAANNGGSMQYTSATNGGGRQGIRMLRVQNPNCAPTFGWHENRTFMIPVQGSTNAIFFGAEIRTPDKSSGASIVNQYSLQVGFNTAATADTNRPIDFVGLIHQTNLFSTVNWFVGCVSNTNSVTWVDTGVGYTNSAWYKLGVYVDGTNMIALINNVPVTTNSANIPFGRAVGASVRNAVFNGTTTLDTTLDKLALQYR